MADEAAQAYAMTRCCPGDRVDGAVGWKEVRERVFLFCLFVCRGIVEGCLSFVRRAFVCLFVTLVCSCVFLLVREPADEGS